MLVHINVRVCLPNYTDLNNEADNMIRKFFLNLKVNDDEKWKEFYFILKYLGTYYR